jgi:hypothetical protein
MYRKAVPGLFIMQQCGKICCTITWGALFISDLTASAQFDYVVTNGTATLIHYHGTGGAVAIPATIAGVAVTKIGDAAFQNQTNIVSVAIPNSVTSILARAFSGCIRLSSVTLPPNLPSIADQTFSQCFQMTDIQIPNNVTNIGHMAFASCNALMAVVLPRSLTSLGTDAFAFCQRLRAVYFMGDAPAMSQPFTGSYQMTAYYLPGAAGFTAATINAPLVVWDARVTAIRTWRRGDFKQFALELAGSSNLAVVVEACTNLLKPVWLPIGTNTLLGGAAEIVDRNAANLSCCFYRVGAARPLAYAWSVSNGTATITGYDGVGDPLVIPPTFNGIPVTDIGNSAFFNLSSLTSVVIPDTVRAIGVTAFGQCINLTNVVLANNVASIGSQAFYGCSALTSISLPASLTTLDNTAFGQCSSLTAISVAPGNPVFKSVDGVLFDAKVATVVEYPPGKLGDYAVPPGVRVIADSAFDHCAGFTNVTLSPNLARIGNHAFSMCPNLAAISFPDSVTNVGVYAFGSCSKLGNIHFGAGLLTIGKEAFGDCGSLSSVILPDTLLNIEEGAFEYCFGLADLVIGNNVTNIAGSAFVDCSMLANLSIPSSVRTIGPFAFDYNLSLTKVTFGNRVSELDDHAFGYCPNITGYYFTGNAPNVSDSTFYSPNATVYHLAGTSGWGPTLGGLPTATWYGP